MGKYLIKIFTHYLATIFFPVLFLQFIFIKIVCFLLLWYLHHKHEKVLLIIYLQVEKSEMCLYFKQDNI